MAAIIDQPLIKTGARRHALKLDMTPMVDLGFLLITFFVFTTSLTQPRVWKLVMPKQAVNQPPDRVYEKALLTAVLGKTGLYVYEGCFNKALAQQGIRHTNYSVRSGLGSLVRRQQKILSHENRQSDLLVLVKPTQAATYQQLIDALDELALNGVTRFAVVDASAAEAAQFQSGTNHLQP